MKVGRRELVGSAMAGAAFMVAGATTASARDSGTLIVAEDVTPQTFDPIQSSQIHTWYMWQFVYEGLLRADLDGSLKPLLATKWTASADGKVYDFTLRAGAKFADGSPVTADDVVASFERLKTDGLPYAQSRFKTVAAIEAVDPGHVRFKLATPDAGFLLNVGNPFVVGSAILSKAWLKSHNPKTEMMGTGPFAMVSYSPNQQLVLRRNEYYWNKAAAAKVANLIVRFMPEQSAQIAGLVSGQIDLMFPSAESMLQLRHMSSISSKAVASTNTVRLNINTNVAPFNNVDFRRAMSLALSRKDVVAGAFLGQAKPSAQLPPAYSWAPPLSELKYQKQDIAKAKALLAKSGYPHGIDITLNHLAGYASYLDRFADVLKTDFAKAGIRVKIEANQTAVWLDKQNHANYQIMDNEYAYQADPMFYLMPRPGRQGPTPAKMQALIDKAQTGPADAYTTNLANLERMQDDMVFPDIAVAARYAWVAYTKKLDSASVNPEPTLSRTFLAAVAMK